MSILECAECGRTVDVMDIGVKAAIVKRKAWQFWDFYSKLEKGTIYKHLKILKYLFLLMTIKQLIF